MRESAIGVGIGILIIGMTMFWTGFHNADLSQNYYRIYSNYGLDYGLCKDCGVLGCTPCDAVYINGVYFALLGAYTLMCGGLVFGFALGGKQ